MTDSITFLGTSDGLPSADRHHTSLLLKLGGRQILLDCGEPCSHSLKRLRVDFRALDAVIVTHTHSDHIGGLPMLLQSLWLEQRTRPLPLWLPPRAIAPLQNWLRVCLLFEEQFGFPIHWHALDVNKPIHVGRVRLRVFRTSHLDWTRSRFGRKYPMASFDAFSVRAEADGKRVGYSADLGAPEDLVPLCAKPLDALVVELAHYRPEALAAVLQDRQIRHIAITHMGRSVRSHLAAVKARLRTGLHSRHLTYVADGSVIRF